MTEKQLAWRDAIASSYFAVACLGIVLSLATLVTVDNSLAEVELASYALICLMVNAQVRCGTVIARWRHTIDQWSETTEMLRVVGKMNDQLLVMNERLQEELDRKEVGRE